MVSTCIGNVEAGRVRTVAGGREGPHSPWWLKMDDEGKEGRERLIGNSPRLADAFFVKNRELFVVVGGGEAEAGGNCDWDWDWGGEGSGLGRLAMLRLGRFRYLFPIWDTR